MITEVTSSSSYHVKHRVTKHERIWPLIDPAVAGNYASQSAAADGLLNHVHPAHRYLAEQGFDGLLAQLERECAAGNVKKSDAKYVDGKNADGDLQLYVYSKACEASASWSPASLMARGLVLDVKTRRIAATPFWKFFNDFEDPQTLDRALEAAGHVRVTEKMDGSLGIVFYHSGRWRVCTKGSFHSPQADWGTEYLEAHFDTSRLVRGTTYLGELIYPENRIVVPYSDEQTGITWLAAFAENGREYMLERLECELGAAATEGVRVKMAGQLVFASLDDLRATVSHLPWSREGFVVLSEGMGFRAKLKGPAYLSVHKNRSLVTPGNVWGLLRSVLTGVDSKKSRTSGKDKVLEASAELKELEQQLDEETAVDYYVLKNQILDTYLRLLAWLASMREVLQHSPAFASLPKREVATLQASLKKLATQKSFTSDLDDVVREFQDCAAGSTAAFILEVVTAWRGLWAQEGGGLQASVGYAALVQGAVDRAGRTRPEDPEAATRVSEELRKKAANSGTMSAVPPEDAFALLHLTIFWVAGKPEAEGDALGWLAGKDRAALFDRFKPSARAFHGTAGEDS